MLMCGLQVQVVNFHETLKCIAKGVCGIDVRVEHAPSVGNMHEWLSACLIQVQRRTVTVCFVLHSYTEHSVVSTFPTGTQ